VHRHRDFALLTLHIAVTNDSFPIKDEQAEQFFLGLITESVNAVAPRVMEVFHRIAVARR
jgi:hypothetical protein